MIVPDIYNFILYGTNGRVKNFSDSYDATVTPDTPYTGEIISGIIKFTRQTSLWGRGMS